MRFSQIHVDAAREKPAEIRVHHLHWRVVRRRPRQPHRKAHQSRLRCPRAVHKDQLCVRRLRRTHRRRGRPPWLPRTEMFFEQGLQCRQFDVSRDHQRRIVRKIILLPKMFQVVARNRLNGFRSPAVRISIRVMCSKKRRRQDAHCQ